MSKRNIVRAAVAVAVVLAAFGVPSCSCRDEAPPQIDPAGQRAWVCEACGHTFAGPNDNGLKACPSCGKEAAVRAILYKCGKCGTVFEAYRFLDTTGMDKPKGPDGKPIEEGMLFKRKGGEWVGDEEALGQTTCPKCGNADRSRMQLTVPPAKGK